jgi:hypothetical protein
MMPDFVVSAAAGRRALEVRVQRRQGRAGPGLGPGLAQWTGLPAATVCHCMLWPRAGASELRARACSDTR